MRRYLIFFFLCVGISSYATKNITVWGQTGHRVVGEIAYSHLTKKAKKNLEKLLKGEGLAIISTYADEIKSDNAYRKFSAWHYVNFKEGEAYETGDKNPKGDAVPIIKKAMKRLNIREDITPAMSIYQNAISKLVEKARQLKDPKKEMMVKSKNTGVVVIDKKDFKKYEKQGYFAVEEVEVDEHKGKKKHKHPHLMTKDGELATVDEKKKEKEVVFKGTPAQIKKQMKDLRKKVVYHPPLAIAILLKVLAPNYLE